MPASAQDPAKEHLSIKKVQAAQAKLAKRDFMGAATDADAAIRLAPRNIKAYNLKATALNRLGRFEEAEAASQRSLELISEGNPAAYDNLAWAQLNLGKYQEAILSVDSAVRMNPNDAQAFAIRAYASEQLKDERSKLAAIERAAALAPSVFGAHLKAARQGRRMFRPGTGSASVEEAKVNPFAGIGKLALFGAFLLIVGCLSWIAYTTWTRVLREPGPQEAEVHDRQDGGLLAGKYRLEQVIGHGGMGQVWEGTDVSLGRTVALKKMSTDLGKMGSKVREYYLQEARTVASLHHPHIIAIYEILDLENGLFLVFEMAKGKTVQHVVAEEKHLSLERALAILQPVCEALDYAHGRGVVHRDLKPSNIMLTDQGFVKVMDFGIARKVSETVDVESEEGQGAQRDSRGILMDHTQTIVGTPIYMSPEAERGLVTSVSDVYSLGVCFYEMVTGRPPFSSRAGLTAKIDREFIKPTLQVPGLPTAVDALVYEVLDPNPEQRIPSAREFMGRLAHVVELSR